MSTPSKNETPFFSVIIPTFNRSSVLTRAIDSVLNQHFGDFELIVVDDGSTDDTQRLLEQYEGQLTFLRQNNKGVSSARNFGASIAKGEWLSFLDSDDEWLPHKLDLQWKFIQDHSHIPIVHGEEIWIRNGKRVNPKRKHQKFGGYIFKKCLPLCLISPSAVSIKKDIYLEHGGFDENFIVCEDYDLWLKLTSLYEVGFVETPIINKYGGHEDQLSHKYFAMDIWRLRSMTRILQLRNLPDEERQACLEEMQRKAHILRMGYHKHNNSEGLREVDILMRTVEGQ